MILVDAAIGSKDLVDPLKRLGLPVTKTHLPFGDVAFVGRGLGGTEVGIGIELKKFRDLISSLRSGRLQGHQLIGLQQAYDYRWLIIEGSWKQGRYGELIQGKTPVHGGMTGTELEKRLVTLEVQGGLRIRHTYSRADTLRVIGNLYRWWTDVSLDRHVSHIAIYTPASLVPLSQFRRTIATLPGIGLKMSQVAERHFKTINRAVHASIEEWSDVDGVGRTTAEKIVKAIRGVK